MIPADLTSIWGAVYAPARAYNAYQAWRDYDRRAVERDLGYAAKVRLNALRLWLSYEHWLENPDGLHDNFDHLLATAESRGLRVLPVLFECCGVDPDTDTLRNRDPLTAVCVRSPGTAVIQDPARWDRPCEFVSWFLARWGSDPRVLAVEAINEPAGVPEFKFTRALFESASRVRGSRPLTLGSLHLEDSRLVQDLGLDVLQVHENFHRTDADLRARLRRAADTQEILGRPVWVTEWQRLRPGGSGWGNEPVGGDEWQPAYATMCDAVRSSGLAGAFFWSLMVRPAYLPSQRRKGTLNGLFHEDGAVWSLDDARAIGGDPRFFTVERREWPDWAKPIRQAYLDKPR